MPLDPAKDEPPRLPDAAWRRGLRRSLLDWFGRHARDLPWRRTRDPYRIWISEIMLQQTQVVTVIPYFERFTHRFSDVRELAEADEQEVLRLWEGLGYYRRARQMHAAARQIALRHAGQFPETYDEVLQLPGVGRYTAGTIMSIAWDARRPILEANSLRIFSRLLAYRDDVTRGAAQKLLWEFAEQVLPRKQVGAFNPAVMELGSEVCRPKEPPCGVCPVSRLCPTRAAGLQALIPAPKRKTRYEEVREAAVVVHKDQRVLIRRCGEGERWAGLWDFPRFPVRHSQGDALRREIEKKTRQLIRKIETGRRLTTIKHGVTRFRITLHCFEARFTAVNQDPPATGDDDFRWVAPGELAAMPLSVTGRKIANLLY